MASWNKFIIVKWWSVEFSSILYVGDAHVVMVINIGNGHGEPSSNPGLGCFHFT